MNIKHIVLKILTWLFIFLFPPVGILLLFKAYPNMTKKKRTITIACALIWFLIMLVSGSSPSNSPDNNQSSVVAENTTIVESTQSTTIDNPTTETQTEQITETPTEISTEITTEASTPAPAEVVTEAPTEEITEAPIEDTPEEINEEITEAPIVITQAPVSNEKTYVLNTNTKKFHKQSCSEVKKIKDTNLSYYTGTANEVIQQGYSACKKCNPS